MNVAPVSVFAIVFSCTTVSPFLTCNLMFAGLWACCSAVSTHTLFTITSLSLITVIVSPLPSSFSNEPVISFPSSLGITSALFSTDVSDIPESTFNSICRSLYSGVDLSSVNAPITLFSSVALDRYVVDATLVVSSYIQPYWVFILLLWTNSKPSGILSTIVVA